MQDENIINKKYKLITEICSEPFGNYYVAESILSQSVESVDSVKSAVTKQYLILVLSQEASILARQNLARLQDNIFASKEAKEAEETQENNNKIMWPVLEVLDIPQDPNAVVSIVMPYVSGCSLAMYFNNLKKPLKLRRAMKFLLPLIKKISSEHISGKFHGFINFSTIWVTKDKKLKLIGFDIFNIIFEKLEIKSSDFYQPKISSCLSEDNQSAKITFSIASDYYSMLVIASSLLNGCITTGKTYTFTPNTTLNKKARKLLTADYYREAYQDNQSLEEWFGQILRTLKWPVLENFVALMLIISIFSVLAYQYKPDLKLLTANSYYQSLTKYLDHGTQINNTEDNNRLTNNYQVATEKIISIIPTLDVEGNLYNFTAGQEYPNTNTNNISGKISDHVSEDETIESIINDINNNPKSVDLKIATAPVSQANRLEPISNVYKVYNIVAHNSASDSSFKCNDSGTVCRESIVDLVNGPKMIKVNFSNEQAWIMQAPISRRDYYTYCYFVDDCKQKQQIADSNMLKCLFENICTDEANVWLNYPITGMNFADLNKYQAWLNKVTKGGYQIMTDKYWPVIASKFNPEQSCVFIFNNADDFIAMNKPEFVAISGILAIRTTPKLISGEESFGEPQCQTVLQTDGITDNQGETLIRLIKKVT